MVRGVGRLSRVAVRPLQRGKRLINWTPETGVGFGNVLYAWLYAHQRQAHGEDVRVLVPEHLAPWRAVFPSLWDELSVQREEVRLTDRRTWVWHSRFGVDFSRAELESFVQAHLAPGIPGTPAAETQAVTINVRRGDYYSQPHFRGTYSFDIAAYLRAALDVTRERHGNFSRLLVVSDGPDWCKVKLDALLTERADLVQYAAASESPQDNFLRLARSSRLIGTNSSFSYWGGYVSNVRFVEQSHVLMPRFHARLRVSTDAYQLDPSWTIIDDIPGGWDS